MAMINNIRFLQAFKNMTTRRTTFSIHILVTLYLLLLLICQLTSPTIAFFHDSETVTTTIPIVVEEQKE